MRHLSWRDRGCRGENDCTEKKNRISPTILFLSWPRLGSNTRPWDNASVLPLSKSPLITSIVIQGESLFLFTEKCFFLSKMSIAFINIVLGPML